MNITKRESAYRIRVFCGKDEKGNSKFLYQTVRFDDPRFEGMTEKKRDKAIEAIAFEFEKQVGSLNVLPNVTFKCFAEKWFTDYVMPKSNSQPLLLNAARTLRIEPMRLLAICEWIKSKSSTFRSLSILSPNPAQTKYAPKGLSYKTIKHYRSFISEIFDYAIRIEMLTKNP